MWQPIFLPILNQNTFPLCQHSFIGKQYIFKVVNLSMALLKDETCSQYCKQEGQSTNTVVLMEQRSTLESDTETIDSNLPNISFCKTPQFYLVCGSHNELSRTDTSDSETSELKLKQLIDGVILIKSQMQNTLQETQD